MKSILVLLSLLHGMLLYHVDAYCQELDESFGTGGTVVTEFGFGYDKVGGMLIQPDQKIVMGGIAKIFGVNKAALSRFNTDGSPDLLFGSNGIALSNYDYGDVINQSDLVAIQTDGKLLLASNTGLLGFYNLCVTRFDADGTIDESFGTAGSAIVSVLSANNYAYTMALQSDGKILVGGIATDVVSPQQLIVVRLKSDGTLDSSFNGTGKWMFDTGYGNDGVNNIVVQPDGRIVITTMYSLTLIRLNPDGSFDNSFGNSGLTTLSLSEYNEDYPSSTVILQDEKLIVCGNTRDPSDINYTDVFIARFNADGTPDNSFGDGGAVISHLTEFDDYPETMIVTGNGKYLIAGRFKLLSNEYYGMIVRYNSVGTPDTTFGESGLLTVPSSNSYIESIRQQDDAKIVIAGTYYSGTGNGYEFGATRYLYDETVGISNPANKQSSLRLFPNPANSTVTVTADFQLHQSFQVSIFDVLGRRVYCSSYFSVSNPLQATLTLDKLIDGIYAVTIESEHVFSSSSLLVSHEE